MSEHPNAPASTIIRRKELATELGVSDTTLWRLRAELPPAVQISKGVRGWKRSDITAWIEKRSIR